MTDMDISTVKSDSWGLLPLFFNKGHLRDAKNEEGERESKEKCP